MAERDFNLQMTGEQVKDALQQLEDRVAEGWAVGEHDGVPVTSGSPYYENNAKYYAEKAGISAQAAADSAATAEQEVEEGIRQGIVGTYVQESATPGAIVTIDDGADDVPLKDLKVNLAINQPGTGDPSPSNVRPIYPVTEAEVTRTGKNLYFKTMANRYINASGVISSSTVNNVMCAYVKKGQTYTISNNGTAATSASYGYYEAEPADAATALTGRLTAANGTFTATMNAYIAVVVLAGNNAVQLELGSTATAYEPYAGQQYLVNIGINQWDEEWEVGSIDGSTGEPTSNSNYIRSKNFCPCLPNTDYYFKNADGTAWTLFWYDKTQTFISVAGANNSVRTSPANAYYFKVRSGAYVATYANTCSINYPSRFTAYYPYTGNVVYGGELDVTTGVLTARYGMVDLGTLTWALNSGSTFWGIPTGKLAGLDNFVCSDYATTTADIASMANCTTTGRSINQRVYIRDDRYTDAATFKTAMSGVQLVYELATPISIQLDPTAVNTLRGDNVIWADCGDITNCEYRADLKMYIDKVVGA